MVIQNRIGSLLGDRKKVDLIRFLEEYKKQNPDKFISASRFSVYQWIDNKNPPHPDTMEAISIFFKKPINQIFYFAETQNE